MTTHAHDSAVSDRLRQFDEQIASMLDGDVHLRAYSTLLAAESDSPQRVVGEEAAEQWRQHLAKDPDDLTALHHLTVIVHGQAIEAQRAGKSVEETGRLWRDAMQCWSKLWKAEMFWKLVEERWARLADSGSAIRDSRADRFSPQRWDLFRRRLPSMLLGTLVELARAHVLERQQVSACIKAILDSGFEPEAIDQARRSIYSAYKPDIDTAVRESSFEAAVVKIKEYAAFDESLPDLWQDMLELYVKWFDYLTKNKPDDKGLIDRVAKASEACAAQKGLRRLAKSDPSVARWIVTLCGLMTEWFIRRSNEYGQQRDGLRSCESLDSARAAAGKALGFKNAGVDLSERFGYVSYHAAMSRLQRCESAQDSAMHEAENVIAQIIEVDNDNPFILIGQAELAAAQGNSSRWSELLKMARAAGQDRGFHSAVQEVNECERRGPMFVIITINEAIRHYNNRSFRACVTKALEANKLAPGRPDIELLIGESYLMLSDHSEAKRFLSLAKGHAAEQGRYELVQGATRALAILN